MPNDPPKSRTKDTSSHHTSPVGMTPQQELTPLKQRTVTGVIRSPSIPVAPLKHSNPVGRPKLPRG